MKISLLLEKFRNHGYTLPQSLAELADNSITFNAKNIWIYMYWSDDLGKNSFVMVVDDGGGMNENELVNKALTIPKEDHVDRGEGDLSRFGLGLKTGSFEHCRSITVITKKGKIIKKTLNFKEGLTDEMPSCINHKFVKKYLDNFEKQNSGTIILWSDLDRISRIQAIDRAANFYSDYERSRKHFKLIYHKFILDKKINIYFGGNEDVNKTKIFDPFYKENKNTIKLQDVEISFFKGGSTILKPWIIPQDTGNENLNFTKNELQGLYFFRRKRLIDYGGWFEIGDRHTDRFWSPTDRFNRLRIEVELPLENDDLWISYSKNKVTIPKFAISKFRKHLKKIRKDYLEKISSMSDDPASKEPVNETLKKKKELTKMIGNKMLNDEDLSKIEALIKKL